MCKTSLVNIVKTDVLFFQMAIQEYVSKNFFIYLIFRFFAKQLFTTFFNHRVTHIFLNL